MCGRYKLHRSDKSALAKRFGVRVEDIPDFADEMDNAPGSWRTVVATQDGERTMLGMRWGFQMEIQGKSRLVFNTKAEGVLNSPLWKARFAKDRCIVPASAFFEWKKVNGKTGPKFEITVPGQSEFGLAGLWGAWTNPKTKIAEKTFSIFTTEPKSAMQAFHNRQPVILDPAEYEEWLSPTDRSPVHLLRVLPDERMHIAPVEPAKAVQPVPITGNLFE